MRGTYQMIIAEIPLRLYSLPNVRWHWSKKARTARHARAMTRLVLAGKAKPKPPLVVTLTRVGKRDLDDDNLVGAFKHVRDGVADWLGVDDGSELVEYECKQERGNYGIRIEITRRRTR